MTKRPNKITDFKNDVLFKYLLNNDKDPRCIYLLKLIIENIIHIKCKDIKVLNPDINPQNVKDKDMILDIRVQTDTGIFVNIEMQFSSFSTCNYNRFQNYGANGIVVQSQVGDKKYRNIKAHYQIIFINDIDKDNFVLIDTYKSRNDRGIVEKHNLITRSYVQIPMIDIIAKEKGIENLTELEWLIYVFKNGLENSIMNTTNQKVMKIMKEKMETFNEDIELRLAAYNRELNIMAHIGEKQEAYDKGIKEGKLELLQDLMKMRYGIIEEDWLKTLNEKQLESIKDIIFKEESYEVFKQKVETVKEID